MPSQPMGYAELKHHSRLDCPDQPRDSYVPPPYDKTPCYLNEKTCTSFYNDTGMGQAINITYDWKHLMYEDYDRWLYNRSAASFPSLLAETQCLLPGWACISSHDVGCGR